MNRFFIAVVAILLLVAAPSMAEVQNPKREFRGAWLHVIGQSQYQRMSPQQCRQYISSQLDKLKDAGCNAVFFQVRPTADALYISDLEPWSAWLTGRRGVAPNPLWDPLKYIIAEAHERGMELHAWLNPYRVTSDAKEVLPASHLAKREPHRFVKFNGQTFFDPAYQENREYIARVVADIVERYDVDGIHIDDYFYPYPSGKKRFNGDDASYAKFGNGMNRADWRRQNVDSLIELLHSTIKDIKPWVRFGVSPFGIWRNKRTDPRGSDSSGLQNYDDLYADPLLWARKGWIDYLVPQLYWELDLAAAPSRKLARWWNDNASDVDIYIGWDTKRTMDKADPGNNSPTELDTKVSLSRSLENIKGNVWWHGYWVTDNYRGVADELASHYQSTIALPPAYGESRKKPSSPEGLKIVKNAEGLFLEWDLPHVDADLQKETDAVRYVVYEFFEGEKADMNDSATIIALTPHNRVLLSGDANDESLKGTYFYVTALDRMNRESEPSKISNK